MPTAVQMTSWQAARELSDIAHDEMDHLGAVQQLLAALGAPPPDPAVPVGADLERGVVGVERPIVGVAEEVRQSLDALTGGQIETHLHRALEKLWTAITAPSNQSQRWATTADSVVSITSHVPQPNSGHCLRPRRARSIQFSSDSGSRR